MMPKPETSVFDDVQATLAQATPAQLRRLLADIARQPVKGAVKYDA